MKKDDLIKKIKEIKKQGIETTQNDGSHYIGQIKNTGFKKQIPEGTKLIFHGFGILTESNGNVYKGQFLDGKPDGHGEYSTQVSNIFGLFKQGKIVWGEAELPDGIKYQGEFRENKFHGEGKMNIRGEREYDGYFKNDLWNGKGTLWYLKDVNDIPKGSIYRGSFINGEPDGNFEIEDINGLKADAKYENGKQVFFKIREEYYLDKKIEKTKFKNDNYEYDGYVDCESGKPHGKGIAIEKNDNGKIFKIEDGFFNNEFLVEGSEITYFGDYIKKETGVWKIRDDGICEEMISGKGEELYFKTEEDHQMNKPFGYVKGFFDYGSLIEGEILNPSLIEYSEHNGIKKIIYKKANVREILFKEINHMTKLKLGEIYYDDGAHYVGELHFDLPFGKGTMTLADGSSKTCEWYNGNVVED